MIFSLLVTMLKFSATFYRHFFSRLLFSVLSNVTFNSNKYTCIIIAPTPHCGPPPGVSNTHPAYSHNATVGDRVRYSCDESYKVTGGDFHLVCVLREDYTAMWEGDTLKCTEEDGKVTIMNVIFR